MTTTIKLKKGFTINLQGKPEATNLDFSAPKTFAIKPTDFPAISRPKVMVNEGDKVKAGTPVLYDKVFEDVYYCSPVSGTVKAVERGAKRKLLAIVIEKDAEQSYVDHGAHSVSEIANLSAEDAKALMVKGGVWPHIVQRPFGVVADPKDTPRDIFVSAFDTHPLAPNLDISLKDEEAHIQAGINILNKFITGRVHLNLGADVERSPIFDHLKNVELHRFSGKHPAGNVGVQIHHIKPINKGDVVWTVTPQGLAEIGRLFLKGHYDATRKIAVTGSEATTTGYVTTYAGACVSPFVEGNLVQENVRVVSGNPLTGEKVAKDGHLGFYHNQVTLLPEGDSYELFGWILPTTKKLSFHRAVGLLSFLTPKKEYRISTNTHGEERPFVMTGEFEQVLPMDILPTQLMKAVITEDFDAMEGLGIYEVVEEDLALCEFIDVSKHNIQELLREGLDLVRESA